MNVAIVRSAIAVLGGFVVFSMLFAVLARTLGGVLGAGIAGVMAGYLTGKIAARRERAHGAAAALLAAASMFTAPLALPERGVLAIVAALAVTAGGWVRGNARPHHTADPGPPGQESHS